MNIEATYVVNKEKKTVKLNVTRPDFQSISDFVKTQLNGQLISYRMVR